MADGGRWAKSSVPRQPARRGRCARWSFRRRGRAAPWSAGGRRCREPAEERRGGRGDLLCRRTPAHRRLTVPWLLTVVGEECVHAAVDRGEDSVRRQLALAEVDVVGGGQQVVLLPARPRRFRIPPPRPAGEGDAGQPGTDGQQQGGGVGGMTVPDRVQSGEERPERHDDQQQTDAQPEQRARPMSWFPCLPACRPAGVRSSCGLLGHRAAGGRAGRTVARPKPGLATQHSAHPRVMRR